ncbi:dipeptidase PepV [Clostridium guangxiense]|uniref:dipeptidase PepV n=1 Tax=Clostridium guangxiense TaxID=1662055 RepID=UPI001E40BBBB|nr:dipeptidase PepV [Clostridium guangxiense]MCD2347698.1 dipeptidase PepV [Clostridium guangxiense]
MEINKHVDLLKDELVKSTQKVLQIKSVQETAKPGMPYGEGPAKALACALEIAKSLGFKTVNVDNQVGYAEYGDGEEYIGVLGHLDVVPENDGWKYPPYAAEIHDDKIFARGATDDKGPIMACLYGLKAIVDSGLTLSKKVRIIFGTNEETGSNEIAYYLKKEKPPVAGFTPDAEYPIINGEKGVLVFDLLKEFEEKSYGDTTIAYVKGGNAHNIVPNYCEAGLKTSLKSNVIDKCEDFSNRTGYDIKAEEQGDLVIIKSYGVAAHGSLPHMGKNAIMQLLAFIGELNLEQCDAVDYIDFLNRHVGMETDGESFGVGLEDEVSKKLSFNLGMINLDVNKASVTIDIRYPVTCKFEEVITPINERIEAAGIKLENMTNANPLYFPEDHFLVKNLQKVYKEQTGKEPKLLAIGGGTYAKEMPNIVAFGPIFEGEPDVDHKVDEYIKVEHLILNAKIYAHTIYELAK